MTRALDRGEQDVQLDELDTALAAAAVRISVEMELLGILETSAACLRERYGATGLIVDRTIDDTAADITVVIGEAGLADLWDLDPVLWGDVNYASVRYLPADEVSYVPAA